jgi:lipoate-protein ligase A
MPLRGYCFRGLEKVNLNYNSISIKFVPPVHLFNFSAESPELNLALDEALLLTAEQGAGDESIRFWSSHRLFVVLGYSRSAQQDVDLEACHRDGIPVLRRHSGGGTVVQGPGCLNYNLVLRMDRSNDFSTITGTTRAILGRHAAALAAFLPEEISPEGESDLVFRDRKFSGNAQRRLGTYIEFHGTVLYDFDVSSLSHYLREPDRQPAYRRKRNHLEFVSNIPLKPQFIQDALAAAWGPTETLVDPPLALAQKLVAERYGRREWNLRSSPPRPAPSTPPFHPPVGSGPSH